MLEGRDADCGHAQQNFSVGYRWFWQLCEPQPAIAAELFRPHRAHVGRPVMVMVRSSMVVSALDIYARHAWYLGLPTLVSNVIKPAF
jgi:hypothetical protein